MPQQLVSLPQNCVDMRRVPNKSSTLEYTHTHLLIELDPESVGLCLQSSPLFLSFLLHFGKSLPNPLCSLMHLLMAHPWPCSLPHHEVVGWSCSPLELTGSADGWRLDCKKKSATSILNCELAQAWKQNCLEQIFTG